MIIFHNRKHECTMDKRTNERMKGKGGKRKRRQKNETLLHKIIIMKILWWSHFKDSDPKQEPVVVLFLLHVTIQKWNYDKKCLKEMRKNSCSQTWLSGNAVIHVSHPDQTDCRPFPEQTNNIHAMTDTLSPFKMSTPHPR